METAKRSLCGRYLKIHIFLRLLAAFGALVASILMGLNEQTSIVAGFTIKASYESSPTFKFFVIGNGIVCVYLFGSLLLFSKSLERCVIDILDLVNLSLLTASASAATAIGYVGRYGNEKIGWMKVCPLVEEFCRRSFLAVACSYAALLLFFFSMCARSFHLR
ncbi:CASP-like protein 1C2 [Curcuma longa]|uniref:CASP-like protein 1C2 n=1 Tax=Curcuma longa TaxID=136217 RepID=UPI003D9E5F40